MQKYIFLIILANIFLVACVKQPPEPVINANSDGDVFVLSEGLLGRSNSTLSILDSKTNSAITNYFEIINPGYKIGDTANGMALFGDTMFIAVSGSETIEAVSLITGKSLGRIKIPGSCPRKICIVNDSIAYATDLYSHNLIKFNPKNIKFIENITGLTFYPEGITYSNGKLYVANSGLGVFFKKNPLAGTISIIDEQKSQLIKNIFIGKNLAEIAICYSNNTLFLCYYNTYEKDSVGGIVQISLDDYKEKRRIKGHFRSMNIAEKVNRLYVINQVPPKTTGEAIEGIVSFSLNVNDTTQFTIVKNKKIGEYWYSLMYNDELNELWIGNAKNFQVEGEVFVYNMLAKNIIKRYPTGINPNTIISIK